jgi:membrane protease YdiL (CAAX protease family)
MNMESLIFLLMPAQTERARDLLVYFAFCALPIAGFLLQNEPGATFDVALLTISLLVILWFKVYYKDTSQLVDFDENLTGESMMWIVLGIIGCLALSTFMVSSFVHTGYYLSSIWVPRVKLGLAVGSLVVPTFWNNVLFTLTLVVTAEECSKLVASLGIYMWFKGFLGKTWASVVAIAGPIGGWAYLHTYANPEYQTAYALIFVLTAFLAGLIMFYVMKRCKSLLAAMLVHAGYNIIVLYLTYVGFAFK